MFYRTRATHDTEGKPMYREQPWQVCCKSHAHAGTCATMAIEPLEGNWVCAQCRDFDFREQTQLREALTAPDFSHTTIRGFYGSMGCVYRKDSTSPSGVRSSGGFDPHCAKAMEMVKRYTGTPYNGAQSGTSRRGCEM